jgi:nitrogenase molybdenum-iron protein beta chain
MMTDSHTWLHGKKFALYGDADFVMGMTKFLLELGAEPTHVLCNHANKRWKKAMEKMLAASPYGQEGKVYTVRICGTCARCASPTSRTS